MWNLITFQNRWNQLAAGAEVSESQSQVDGVVKKSEDAGEQKVRHTLHDDKHEVRLVKILFNREHQQTVNVDQYRSSSKRYLKTAKDRK